MAAPDPNIHAFIKRLTLGTDKGSVEWTAAAEKWFEFETGTATAVIRSENEFADSHPYSFTLRNADGFVIAQIDTVEGGAYSDWEEDVERLFQAARNQALGVKRTIDALVDELKLPELPPPVPDDIPF